MFSAVVLIVLYVYRIIGGLQMLCDDDDEYAIQHIINAVKCSSLQANILSAKY